MSYNLFKSYEERNQKDGVDEMSLPRLFSLITGSVLLGVVTFSEINAQPNKLWKQYFFITWELAIPVDLVIDQSTNVYVAINVDNEQNDSRDWATIKYDSFGNEEWVVNYDGSGNGKDQSTSIAIDSFGDIYVTGFSWDSTTGFDYTTIKYSPEGDQLWIRKYDGPMSGDDKASDIFIDGNNDVFITGESPGNGTFRDFATVKYNSDGIEQWVVRYNGAGDSTDVAIAIEVDSDGNVFVAGNSFDSATKYDYVVVKYNSNGVEQWVAKYNGSADLADIITALSLDDNSNVYVTGYSYGLSSMRDFATIKYDSSGVEQWVARFNGESGKNDVPRALVVGKTYDIFVTGSSYSNDTKNDYATIKYNADGEEEWVSLYSGSMFPHGSGYPVDRAIDIAIDNSNSVYVTGYSSDNVAGRSLIETIKYNSNGENIWISEESSNTLNYAHKIEVDDSSNIYLLYSGSAMTFNGITIITVKYSQEIVAVKNEGIIADKYYLSQNHPNPFNPSTTIEYSLLRPGDVSLIIYNLLGEEVVRLVDGEMSAGNHSVTWDASNVSSGIYFYRLQARDFVQTRKMILLK